MNLGYLESMIRELWFVGRSLRGRTLCVYAEAPLHA